MSLPKRPAPLENEETGLPMIDLIVIIWIMGTSSSRMQRLAPLWVQLRCCDSSRERCRAVPCRWPRSRSRSSFLGVFIFSFNDLAIVYTYSLCWITSEYLFIQRGSIVNAIHHTRTSAAGTKHESAFVRDEQRQWLVAVCQELARTRTESEHQHTRECMMLSNHTRYSKDAGLARTEECQ